MLIIKSYKELIVWQKGMKLVKEIFLLTENFPKTEAFGITSQMRRAAISVPSNIPEGYRRGSRKEYLQFLKISLGSNAELEAQLSLSRYLGFIDESKFKEIYELNEEVGRLLSSYIKEISA